MNKLLIAYDAEQTGTYQVQTSDSQQRKNINGNLTIHCRALCQRYSLFRILQNFLLLLVRKTTEKERSQDRTTKIEKCSQRSDLLPCTWYRYHNRYDTPKTTTKNREHSPDLFTAFLGIAPEPRLDIRFFSFCI